ncbi:hypothetical protein [Methylobacterium nigriterrae]|uniref:hypothetical protein n=1 Tax=Methylobacterium nigriterrae TaxID=3127512 RepID=UPI0030137F03
MLKERDLLDPTLLGFSDEVIDRIERRALGSIDHDITASRVPSGVRAAARIS